MSISQTGTRPKMSAGIATRKAALFMQHNQDKSTAYYQIRIEKYKYKATTQKSGKQACIIEAVIVATTVDNMGHRENMAVTHIFAENQFDQYFYAENRNFLEACLGPDVLPTGADLSDEEWFACMTDEPGGPFAGMECVAAVSYNESFTSRPKVVFGTVDEYAHLDWGTRHSSGPAPRVVGPTIYE